MQITHTLQQPKFVPLKLWGNSLRLFSVLNSNFSKELIPMKSVDSVFLVNQPFKLLALTLINPRYVVNLFCRLLFTLIFSFFPSVTHKDDSSEQERMLKPPTSFRFSRLKPSTQPTHPQIIPDITNHQTQLIPHRSTADSYNHPCSPYKPNSFFHRSLFISRHKKKRRGSSARDPVNVNCHKRTSPSSGGLLQTPVSH